MSRLLLVLAGGLGLLTAAPAAALHAKGAAPARISQGAEVALTDYLVPGKTTVFDFTSAYCGPCQAYTQPLALLHTRRADLAIVEVDLNRPGVRGIDWQSPVARQFHLHSIPHFKIYGPDGKLVAEDQVVLGPGGQLVRRESRARLMVDRWINGLP